MDCIHLVLVYMYCLYPRVLMGYPQVISPILNIVGNEDCLLLGS